MLLPLIVRGLGLGVVRSRMMGEQSGSHSAHSQYICDVSTQEAAMTERETRAMEQEAHAMQREAKASFLAMLAKIVHHQTAALPSCYGYNRDYTLGKGATSRFFLQCSYKI